MFPTPTFRTDKANTNLLNAEVIELLRTNEEKIITHPDIKNEHLDKYGLHINNIDTRILAKSLLLGAQAIWHAKDSSIKADTENLLNLNENDCLMSICQLLKHQKAGSDFVWLVWFYYTKYWKNQTNTLLVQVVFKKS